MNQPNTEPIYPPTTFALLMPYLAAVGKHLPNHRKNDILAELGANLQAAMEDREEELGHPLTLEDQAAVLRAHGHPFEVAMRYQPQRALIGPLFGVYWYTLKRATPLVVLVFAMTQAVLFYRRTRAHELQVAKLEGQLARAHLQTLNAQIRPHFLFNTLHTIGQLWRSGRSDDADAVLDHLGNLFHKVQRSTSRFEVPLAEELELVREYLAIEEVRFRDRLHTSVSAANGAVECLVPPLILQPIVENAVRHGISAVSTSGTVDVRAEMLARHVRLTVRDDGPGMSAATSQPGSGTGLKNTRERLAQLYGTDAELHICDGPSGGTIVRIDIPLARSENNPRADE